MKIVLKSNALGVAASATLFNDGSVTVRKGSTVHPQVTASLAAPIKRCRKELLREGILVKSTSGNLRFAKDHTFRSSSYAASVILGRQTNGRTAWQTLKGEPLAEVIVGTAYELRASLREKIAPPKRIGQLQRYARELAAKLESLNEEIEELTA